MRREIVLLQERAYGPTDPPMDPLTPLHAPALRPHSFLLHCHDQLVSYAAVVTTTVCADGMSYVASGLSCVATDPDFARRGYASRVVAAASQYIAESQVDLGIFTCAPESDTTLHRGRRLVGGARCQADRQPGVRRADEHDAGRCRPDPAVLPASEVEFGLPASGNNRSRTAGRSILVGGVGRILHGPVVLLRSAFWLTEQPNPAYTAVRDDVDSGMSDRPEVVSDLGFEDVHLIGSERLLRQQRSPEHRLGGDRRVGCLVDVRRLDREPVWVVSLVVGSINLDPAYDARVARAR